MKKPVVLTILDGWGLSEDDTANAPAQAATPVMDRLVATCPHATLVTHGPAVGLPTGQMGNSEVGHTNIGAGRTVWMDLPRIDNAIEDGSLASIPALREFVATLSRTGGTAHLIGLASPGGVHAHQRHIAYLAKVLVDAGIRVIVHAITDGRDVAPKSAGQQLRVLADALPDGAEIGTIVGRFFAMDRDTRWDRVENAYRLFVAAEGRAADSVTAAVDLAYAAGETDEFISPTILPAAAPAKDGDGLMFLNFRADRAREILSALAAPGFDAFDVSDRPDWAACLGMVEYSDAHNQFMSTLFPSESIVNTLGDYVAARGRTQFRIAETEKYPHVTFFLNGGRETPFEGEERHVAPSPKVKTYDLAPEMSAAEVADKAAAAVAGGAFDLVVINFANPDMVGHTGDLGAAIRACEAVDAGLGQVLDAVAQAGGALIVTADHGNCEMMIDPESGGPHTAHTLNPVPVILYGGPEGASLRTGTLGDLAPTVLALMDLPKPDEMTGESLLTA